MMSLSATMGWIKIVYKNNYARYKGNIQNGIKLANELVIVNENILNESCINISKEKQRIKINFYK